MKKIKFILLLFVSISFLAGCTNNAHPQKKKKRNGQIKKGKAIPCPLKDCN